MIPVEISLSTELGKEKLLAQVRSWVESWVKKRFPQDYPNRKLEIDYRRQAEFWITQIEPAASLAVRIAALTHDISRAEEDQKNRSARIVARSLGGLRLPKEFIRNTARLVRDYETGGDFESTLVRDAASIAFLEVKARTGWEARNKIDLMYNRIQTPRAKEIAVPFHKKATARLEEKKEKARQQARAEYRRLVEEAKFSIGLSEEKIEALRKAGDRVLSLG